MIMTVIYLVIGLIVGIDRLSRVTKNDDSSMVCIGIISIIVLWPLYLGYKISKSYEDNAINRQRRWGCNTGKYNGIFTGIW